MTDLNNLIDEVSQLIQAETPVLAELRVKMVELDDFVHSAEFEALNYGDRSRFQTAYKELRDFVRRQESSGSTTGTAGAPSFETSLGSTGQNGSNEQAEAVVHNPFAEQQMEEAERLFYGGRYAEAIKLYDLVIFTRSALAL